MKECVVKKRLKNFLSFSDAKNYIKQFNLTTQSKWFLWAKFNRPSCIPYNPSDIYKSEWKSWMDWLGTNNKTGGQRKYNVNHDYFKKWSHNMAYILGFWWTDGCIWLTNGNYVFSITQNIKEKYILENILKEMGADYLIYEKEYKGRKSCSFNISSKTIVEDILRLGGNFKKSLIAKFPKYVPKKYLPDFIRGTLDGDGCAYKNDKGNKAMAYICGGSREFLDVILEKLKSEIKEFGVKKVYRFSSGLYRLSMSVNDARRLRDYIYSTPSTLKLIRKYEILKDMGKICLQGHHSGENFVNFYDAKKEIQKNGIDTYGKYKAWASNHKGLFPSFPNFTYKKEWKGWKDFFGTERVTYLELLDMVRKEKIKNRTQYYNWNKNLKYRPVGKYPFHPDRDYQEWTDWDTFLGKKCEEVV